VSPVERDEYAEQLAEIQAAMAERAMLAEDNNHRHNLDMLPKRLRLIFKPERKTRSALKLRSPGQWLYAIQKIADKPLRARVACLVWWDYFGGRTIRERWPHLDRYIDAPFVEFPVDAIRRGLFAVGYTALQAYSRAQDTYYQKSPYIKKTKSHAN